MKSMIRTISVCLLIAALLFTDSIAGAQQPPKIARIGVLMSTNPEAAGHLLAAFRQGLHELGQVEEKTFVLEPRYPESKTERFYELARELVGLKVDVILAGTDLAVAAVKKETQTIPIVMANSADPVGTGFVASLARPGGNITGLSTLSSELSGKRLELLKESVPRLSRVAFIWSPNVPGDALVYKETEGAAGSLRLQLQSVEVLHTDDLDRALRAITKGRAQAFIVRNPLLYANRGQIVSFAQKNKLPGMFANGDYVDAGGLMSYGPHLPDLYRRAAIYVDKILKGANPAYLPVEQPTKFEFIINLKTARQIGLIIPQSILYRADKLIK